MPSGNKITFRDVITYVALVASVAFHYGTFSASAEKIKDHDRKIESIEKENAQQNTEIGILDVKIKQVRHEK